MKRMLFVIGTGIAMATAAHAASLAVSPDKLTYNVGETITLTVTGDDEGDFAYFIFGRLDYSGALVDNGTRSQITLTGNNGDWIKGTLSASDNGVNASSEVFNQIAPPFNADTATNLPGTLATVTLIATNFGVVNVNWHTVPDGFHLSFFDVTDAPGTSFTIVPEPATATLLGLGLLALATIRREGTSWGSCWSHCLSSRSLPQPRVSRSRSFRTRTGTSSVRRSG